MEPLVSVLVPTYKRSDYITRALESICKQTYRNIEVVVVDDNVPESEFHRKTLEVLSPYLKRPNFKYIKTAGATGGGAARNYGLKHCTGDYIAFLDDDDRYLPDKIEKQLHFTIEQELEMSYQDVQWNDEQEHVVEIRRMDRVTDFSQQGLLRAHIVTAIAPTSIYMIKRDALLKTEGFGEVPRGQDFIFMLRCIEAGVKIGYMPGVHVVQYLHGGERISTGESFLNAQRSIYELMCSYKPILSTKERRYVDFRFNAVCAFACLRGKQLSKAVPFAFKAFTTSPVDCFKEAQRYFGGRNQ
ncbi:MAG: glycosyltransferase family A protein [Oscillospiraceae bacterium]|jgi:glycosyltransferase involved in cell wall biosynthesis|nr:glycosyltransferase family A protein [Oscillospiraceae bacterium]